MHTVRRYFGDGTIHSYMSQYLAFVEALVRNFYVYTIDAEGPDILRVTVQQPMGMEDPRELLDQLVETHLGSVSDDADELAARLSKTARAS